VIPVARPAIPRPSATTTTAARRAAVRLSGRTLGRLAAAGLLAVVVLGLPAAAAPTEAAAYNQFYANFAGEELMRAINTDRHALGLPLLATDATLERIARDRSIACPSRPSLVIQGRAKDMATRGYLSHDIPGCTDAAGGPFDSFDLLRAFGYVATRDAEVIADNTYPASAVTYATGCSISGSSCRGSTTLPWTVAVTERMFMSSSSHRATLLSTTLTRFGCGAWASSTGAHYFACYVEQGGNGVIDGTAPSIGSLTGVGATFARGSTPTFSMAVTDAHSDLSDGYAAIDGVRIRNWAWDHIGRAATVSAKAPALSRGTHTFTWLVRDSSTHARSVSFQFCVP
jgi:uncharacterized protein YkwD